MTLDFIPVKSSNISEIAYDPERVQMHVKFTNSGHYEYDAVPYTLFNQLLKAESVGKFFNENIKKGSFIFRKADPQ